MLYFYKIAVWLSSDDLTEQQIGLNALKSLLSSRRIESFPQFISASDPIYSESAPSDPSRCPRGSQCSAIRTPRTAYLLRQSLTTPESPDTALLIRKLLPVFPADLQESLRQALREAAAVYG